MLTSRGRRPYRRRSGQVTWMVDGGWRMTHIDPRFHKYSARVFRYSEADRDNDIAQHRYDLFARASLERQSRCP